MKLRSSTKLVAPYWAAPFVMGVLYLLLTIGRPPGVHEDDASLSIFPQAVFWVVASFFGAGGLVSLIVCLAASPSDIRERDPFWLISKGFVWVFAAVIGLVVFGVLCCFGFLRRSTMDENHIEWVEWDGTMSTFKWDELESVTIEQYLVKGERKPYQVVLTFSDGREWRSLGDALVDPGQELSLIIQRVATWTEHPISYRLRE